MPKRARGVIDLEQGRVQGFDPDNLKSQITRRGANVKTNEYAIRFQSPKQKLVYTFIVNPANLKVSRKKLGQFTLTKFGYERQNWGNDLVIFDYSGSTGVFRPYSGNYPDASFDITITPAYLKFKEFEDFFFNQANDSELVRMQFWGYDEVAFQGVLDEFSFTYDPMKEPFVIRYQFKYMTLPVKQIEMQTGIIGIPAADPDTEKARVDTVE